MKACAVSGCERSVRARGWCGTHYMRWKSKGDPLAEPEPPLRGARNGFWKGDGIGYKAAHDRMRALHGPASGHPCADCGGPAEHWSYINDCPDEKIGRRNANRHWTGDILRYCLHPEHYAARCVDCHRRYDGRMV